MILVTVGTQLPFDRLIKVIDDIAPSLGETIFAQVGRSTYRPKNIEFCETMAPSQFDRKFTEATRVVSHAGTGTVLTAKKYRKPVILFPRLSAMGEHRNDHQLATCEQLGGRPGIFVAYNVPQLHSLLSEDLLFAAIEQENRDVGAAAHLRLIEGLASYLDSRRGMQEA